LYIGSLTTVWSSDA